MLAKWWMVGDGLAADGLVWVGRSGRLRRNTAGIIEEREAERWIVEADGGNSEAESVWRMVEGGWWKA